MFIFFILGLQQLIWLQAKMFFYIIVVFLVKYEQYEIWMGEMALPSSHLKKLNLLRYIYIFQLWMQMTKIRIRCETCETSIVNNIFIKKWHGHNGEKLGCTRYLANMAWRSNAPMCLRFAELFFLILAFFNTLIRHRRRYLTTWNSTDNEHSI